MTPQDHTTARACQLFIDRLQMGDANIVVAAEAARNELNRLLERYAR